MASARRAQLAAAVNPKASDGFTKLMLHSLETGHKDTLRFGRRIPGSPGLAAATALDQITRCWHEMVSDCTVNPVLISVNALENDG
jgi:hypothetical protein